MDTYMLSELTIRQFEESTKLVFSGAQLVIVTDTGSRLWYIDIDGMTQTSLLRSFNESENIRVELTAVTVGGRAFEGTGYLHPNVQHHAAAIRGEGELAGFK